MYDVNPFPRSIVLLSQPCLQGAALAIQADHVLFCPFSPLFKWGDKKGQKRTSILNQRSIAKSMRKRLIEVNKSEQRLTKEQPPAPYDRKQPLYYRYRRTITGRRQTFFGGWTSCRLPVGPDPKPETSAWPRSGSSAESRIIKSSQFHVSNSHSSMVKNLR